MPQPNSPEYYDIDELLKLPPEAFHLDLAIALHQQKVFGTYAEFLAFCFCLFDRMFYDSGLVHFFRHTSGIVIQGAINCFREIGEERRATLLMEATMVFKGGNPPRKLSKAMGQAEAFSQEQKALIETFDDRISDLGYTHVTKFYEYVRKNRAGFRPPPRNPPLFEIEEDAIYFPDDTILPNRPDR